jgi:hypothetical protein
MLLGLALVVVQQQVRQVFLPLLVYPERLHPY